MTPLSNGYNNLIQQTEAGLRSLGRAPAVLHEQAVAHTFQTYRMQAQVLAYSNVFLYTSVLAFMVVPFCFFISKKKASGGGGGGH